MRNMRDAPLFEMRLSVPRYENMSPERSNTFSARHVMSEAKMPDAMMRSYKSDAR